MVRTCQWCGDDFAVERKRGNPRAYCPTCCPPGHKVVRVRGRLKLRRWPPAFSMAERQDPDRTPADIQQRVQQILAGHARGRGGEAA